MMRWACIRTLTGWKWIALMIPIFVCYALNQGGAGWQAYIIIGALYVIDVLACDPCSGVSKFVSPQTRVAASVSIIITLCAVFLDMRFYARSWLLVLAMCLMTAGVANNRRWWIRWRTFQSPEVDEALRNLPPTRKDELKIAAVAVWEAEGCRMTKAVLRQSLSHAVPEFLVDTEYKGVFILAFLLGRRWAVRKIEKLQTEVEAAKKEAKEAYWNGADSMRGDIENLVAENERLQARIDELEHPKTVTTEERNALILADLEAGVKQSEIAAKYGVSVARVSQIKKESNQ